MCPKREEEIRKYHQLCLELRQRQEGYTVMVIPMIIGCLGGEIKELKGDLKKNPWLQERQRSARDNKRNPSSLTERKKGPGYKNGKI